jgi:arylformamidase
MNFDLSKYEIIDISYTVIPWQDPDRPFEIQKATGPDRTIRYDIKTHSHVGTHVEVDAHFYEDGKTVTDYPLDHFHGPGVLFPVNDMLITEETCRQALEDKIQEGDIIIVRNDTGVNLTKKQMYMKVEGKVPLITPGAAKWIAKYNPKLLILDFIRYGKDIEEIRQFHDILMSKGTSFVEFVSNLDKLTKERFYVIALPIKVQDIDSSFCRAIVIQSKMND